MLTVYMYMYTMCIEYRRHNPARPEACIRNLSIIHVLINSDGINRVKGVLL